MKYSNTRIALVDELLFHYGFSACTNTDDTLSTLHTMTHYTRIYGLHMPHLIAAR